MPAGAHVVRLRLSHFRSYEALDLDLGTADARPVVLVGPNGSGKTNLLEAVSFLAPGRGLRGAGLAEVTQAGQDESWAVHARIDSGGEPVDIGTGLAPGAGDEPNGLRRVVRIDGIPAPGPAALARHTAILWLTPAMDRLFQDSASTRRRFLDRAVLALHPEHGRHVAAFERAMRERNRLLEVHGAAADRAWLDALEARMAEQAVAIAAARCDAVEALDARAAQAADSPFPRARLRIAGTLEERLAGASALEVEDTYRAELARARSLDAAAGRTRAGPHRSDLLVAHRDRGMPAHQCSTGEQKGLLIGLLLAQARLVSEAGPRAPMLLLDEIAAHLDAARRRALFARVTGSAGQVWMTGTDVELFRDFGARARLFAVSAGDVRPL